jgi:kinesin family protein C2/C3
MLEGQLQGLVHAASGYHQVLADNRQLYNEVQDLKGEFVKNHARQRKKLCENSRQFLVFLSHR